MQEQVKVLTKLRDKVLLTNSLGRTFVKFYYKASPPVANFIANHDFLKATVRLSLLPLVGVSWITVEYGPTVSIPLIVLLLALMGATLVAWLKRSKQRESQT